MPGMRWNGTCRVARASGEIHAGRHAADVQQAFGDECR
jgi:hypothetical protein